VLDTNPEFKDSTPSHEAAIFNTEVITLHKKSDGMEGINLVTRFAIFDTEVINIAPKKVEDISSGKIDILR